MSASLLGHMGKITKINYQYGTMCRRVQEWWGGGGRIGNMFCKERIENTLFDILTREIQMSYPLSTIPKSISLKSKTVSPVWLQDLNYANYRFPILHFAEQILLCLIFK